MSGVLVTGAILLPPRESLPEGAVAYVHLLDSSLADAPATVVSVQVIKNAGDKIEPDRKIKFALYGDIKNLNANYKVSVHIDLDGDGKLSVGDYTNVESYPVISYGYSTYVEVKMVKVK